MINYIIPLIVLFIIIYGLIKGVDIYNAFMDGVLEGLKIVYNIFPSIFAMGLSINILISSNIIYDITNLFNFKFFPKQIIPLAIMRPISGTSSLLLLDHILSSYKPDSIIGRIASLIQGSTDTTIYILGLYFSSVGIKKIRYALIVGLLTDLIAIIISIIVVNKLF